MRTNMASTLDSLYSLLHMPIYYSTIHIYPMRPDSINPDAVLGFLPRHPTPFITSASHFILEKAITPIIVPIHQNELTFYVTDSRLVTLT